MLYQWDFAFLLRYAPLFWKGVLVTLAYTAGTSCSGLIIGLLIGLGRLSRSKLLNMPLIASSRRSAARRCWCRSSGSTTRCRCCWTSRFPPPPRRSLVLSCYTGAFYAEIFRGGIVSIERASGMRRARSACAAGAMMRKVILPQAVKRMIPPFVNQSITQLKNTSLVSTIAVPDLLYQGTLITADTYRPLEVYTVVALIYFAMLFPSTLLAQATSAISLARARFTGEQRCLVTARFDTRGCGQDDPLVAPNPRRVPHQGVSSMQPQRVQYSRFDRAVGPVHRGNPAERNPRRTLEKLRAGVPTADHADRLGARGDPLLRHAARPSRRPAAPAGRPVRRSRSWSSGWRARSGSCPVLQHVALANKHIHDPVTGAVSAAASEFAAGSDAGGRRGDQGGLPEGRQPRRDANKADHLFLWLWEHARAIEAFDLLHERGDPEERAGRPLLHVPRLSPGVRWRRLGQEHLHGPDAPGRCATWRASRSPSDWCPEIDALIEEHGLLTRILRQRSGEDETAAIGELGEAIGRCDDYAEIPMLMAQALADGLSLEGAGEALSIGAAGLFLRSLTGNPMDVHLHTSANLRRYLLRLDGLSLKNKLLTLLLWHTGPEVKSTQYRMEPAPQPDMDAVAALPHRVAGGSAGGDHAEHLHPAADRLVQGDQPRADARGAGGEGHGQPGAAVRAAWLRPAGAHRRASPRSSATTTSPRCTPSSITRRSSRNSTPPASRGAGCIWSAAAQAAAISFGKNMAVYEDALELMHAA